MQNWKTTAAGILSAIIGTLGPISAYLATQNSPKSASVSGLLTVVAAVLRVWIGIISEDGKPTPPPTVPPAVKTGLVLILLAGSLIALSGCTGWERQTYQALAASQSAINSAQAAYEVSAPTGHCPAITAVPCIVHTRAAHDAINKAKQAQTTAVDAMVTYEEAKGAGAGQPALQQAQAAVAAAMANLPTLISDVKTLYGGK